MLWPGPSFGFAGVFKSSASFELSFPFFPPATFVSLAGFSALVFFGSFAFFAALGFLTTAFAADFFTVAFALFFPLLLGVFFVAFGDLETAFLIFFGISTEEF
jgi:hypothetical protein